MKKIFLITVVLGVCIILVSYSNGSNKKAKPIEMPDISDIEAVQITKEGQIVYQADTNSIEELLNEINSSKLDRQSINETPTNVDNYIQMDFMLKDNSTITIFMYQQQLKFNKTNWYIEYPYQGIYFANDNLVKMITD